MTACHSQPDALSGFLDWIIGGSPKPADGTGTKEERAMIADGIAQILGRARLIASLRTSLMRFRSMPVEQGKVFDGLSKLDKAERGLRALDGMTRLAWKAAYKAGKLGGEEPQEAEVGMSGVFAWVALTVSVAEVVAAFVLATPFLAALALVVAAISAIAAIVSILAEENANAQANRRPGDPPVSSLIASGAATAAGLSLLPLLAVAGIGLWLMTRRDA